VVEERLKLAVFIDFDNIQIGVKDTLGKDFDVAIVLEALKERGEVVTKVAYGDWARANEYSRLMTQHAVQMVQRSVTPRGDKNGADINLALDALEMAFTRDHINTFVIVGGDSDFIALVEKLKQYGKRVFVVGGRQFTSGILQRNCHEFLAYENLLKTAGDAAPRPARTPRSTTVRGAESRSLTAALPNIQRALKILAEREVAPQLGLLKSTLLQLDPTFSERDFGTGSFLEFIQKLRRAGLVEMRRTEQGYLVEAVEGDASREEPAEPGAEPEIATAEALHSEELAVAIGAPAATSAAPGVEDAAPASDASAADAPAIAPVSQEDSLALLRQAISSHFEKTPHRPLYLRQIRQVMRAAGSSIDERAGFRGLLDLLHQAQREGWVRLHRDRKGVWRAFPAGPPVQAPVIPIREEVETAEAAEATVEVSPIPESDVLPVETDVNWEAVELPEEPIEHHEPVVPIVVEEALPVEAAPAPKTRKPRAPRSGTKARAKKPSSRRKPKEPAGEGK
jgi:uncharacterized protein (TIGR00288 family)